jgi:hypothetical protein
MAERWPSMPGDATPKSDRRQDVRRSALAATLALGRRPYGSPPAGRLTHGGLRTRKAVVRAVAIACDYFGGEVPVAGVSAVDPAPSTFTSPGLLTTNITTRRFWARPAAVLLLAAGCVGP